MQKDTRCPYNIYFHKEVTFLGSREHYSPKEVAYFIIRKKNEESTIISYEDNPINTDFGFSKGTIIRNKNDC